MPKYKNADGNISFAKADYDVEYEYADGNLVKIVVKDEEEAGEFIYSYSNGNLVKSVFTMDGESSVTDYTYDDKGRMTSCSVTAKVDGKDTVVIKLSYGYDENGKISVLTLQSAPGTDGFDQEITFSASYDDKGRISYLEQNGRYGANKNKAIVTITYNDNDKLLGYDMIGYSFNAEKNEFVKISEESIKYTYDSEGRVISEQEEYKSFDADGKLTYCRRYNTSTAYTEDGYTKTHTNYNYDPTTDTYVEESGSIVKYDKNGNCLSEENYRRGKLVSRRTYKDGRLSCYEYYNEDGSHSIEEYDEYGTTIRRCSWDASGNITYLEEYKFTYGADGKAVSAEHYIDNKLCAYYEYRYDDDGYRQYAKMVSYDGNGKIEYEDSYNEYGDIIERKRYDENGVLDSWEKNEYTYDAEGRYVSKKAYIVNTSTGVAFLYSDMECAYDEDGRSYVKRETVYTDTSGSKDVYEYDSNGRLISYVSYDVAGKVIVSERTEYEVDSEGRILTEKVYSNGKLIRVENYKEHPWYWDTYLASVIYYNDDGSYLMVTYDEYGSEEGRGEYDKDGNLISYSGRESTYDDLGNLINEKYYEDNRLSYEYIYEYDSYGNYLGFQRIYYYEDGWKEISWDDENGFTIREEMYNEKGELVHVDTYEREIEPGTREHLLWEKRYRNGNLVSYVEYYAYDEDGYIKRAIYYDDDGSYREENYSGYNQTSTIWYDNNGNVIATDTYEYYYQIDHWDHIIAEIIYRDGVKHQMIEYYNYEEGGSWKSFVYYDSNGLISDEYLYKATGELYIYRAYVNGELVYEEIL